jgi:hypothetical protein
MIQEYISAGGWYGPKKERAIRLSRIMTRPMLSILLIPIQLNFGMASLTGGNSEFFRYLFSSPIYANIEFKSIS